LSPERSAARDGRRRRSESSFRLAVYIVLDSSGENLIVSDIGNSAIRKISFATGQVTTLVGVRGGRVTSEVGPVNVGHIYYASGLAVDGTSFYAAGNDSTIFKVDSAGTVSAIAGSIQNFGYISNTDGASARFGYIDGLALDANRTALHRRSKQPIDSSSRHANQ